MNYSASFYEEEEGKETKFDKAMDKMSGGNGEKLLSGIVTVISIMLAVGIFIVLPYFISSLFESFIRNRSLMAIIEGVIRIALFLLYVWGISAMKDIRRLYQYHGAEHKTIHCFENGLELTPENAQTFYTLHPRCGTSFLMFVMVVAIIVHAFMGWPNVWLRMATRLLVLPVIAGISYELLKWAGRSNNFIVEILSLPGLYLQKLTTKEPTLKQLEVAIASVTAVLKDGVPYFEGVCDPDGRPVEGEVRYYDPSKGDIKYEGPVGKAAEAAESAAQEADVSAAAPAENEVAKEEEA